MEDVVVLLVVSLAVYAVGWRYPAPWDGAALGGWAVTAYVGVVGKEVL